MAVHVRREQEESLRRQWLELLEFTEFNLPISRGEDNDNNNNNNNSNNK